MGKFTDKVAVVTGGASGIGLAIVKQFLAEGAKVVIADLSEKGSEVAASLGDASIVSFVKTNVMVEDDVMNLVQQTVAQFGSLDIMVANAGIARDGDITDMTYDQWSTTIDINLSGVFLSDKYAIEQMRKQGKGVIVNTGSIHSFVGKRGVTAYAAAKGGVKLLTQTLGATYASEDIRVNAVAPGYIDTPLIAGANKEDLIALHPAGRLGKPEEVGKVVAFLASEDASFVNGTTLLVDGGYTAI